MSTLGWVLVVVLVVVAACVRFWSDNALPIWPETSWDKAAKRNAEVLYHASVYGALVVAILNVYWEEIVRAVLAMFFSTSPLVATIMLACAAVTLIGGQVALRRRRRKGERKMTWSFALWHTATYVAGFTVLWAMAALNVAK